MLACAAVAFATTSTFSTWLVSSNAANIQTSALRIPHAQVMSSGINRNAEYTEHEQVSVSPFNMIVMVIFFSDCASSFG